MAEQTKHQNRARPFQPVRLLGSLNEYEAEENLHEEETTPGHEMESAFSIGWTQSSTLICKLNVFRLCSMSMLGIRRMYWPMVTECATASMSKEAVEER